MANITLGNTTLVEGPVVSRYDPVRGWESVRTFKGDETTIKSKAVELIGDGYRIQVRSGARWELEATAAWDAAQVGSTAAETPVLTWELTGSPVQKDILNSDLAVVESLGDHDLTILRDIFDGKVDVAKFKEASPAFNYEGGNPYALFNLMLVGVRDRKEFQPVLKKNQTVSREYEVAAALSRVGQILTTSFLVLEETTIPKSISNNLPNKTKTAKCERATLFFYWGWLKSYPTITATSWNRIQVTQEFEWGLWPELMYTINKLPSE